jgi:hypothetical protein
MRTNRLVSASSERGCPSRSTSAMAGAFEISHPHPAIAAAAGGTPALRFSRADRCGGSEVRVYAVPGSRITCVIRSNPVGVVNVLIPFTQGSFFGATLGWTTQSLWDWLFPADSAFSLQPSAFV